MSATIRFTSQQALSDLLVFVQRSRTINDGAARLIAEDRFLQVYVGVFLPRGLLDLTPTVLGLRVFQMDGPQSFDDVVPLEALEHRVQRAIDGDGEVVLPTPSPSIAWRTITPPRDGWHRRLGVGAEVLRAVARDGVERVKNALPEAVGEAIVQKVRADVWGQVIPGKTNIPWGAGFAAEALGFLGDKNLAVHTHGKWIRLTSQHGYVLVKSGQPLDNWDDAQQAD
jgi:hypothetical protein